MKAAGVAPAPVVGNGDRPVAVVAGGGVSGVAAAWYLRRAGWAVTLVEAADRLGGRAAAGRLGDREVTLGGKNIGRHYRRVRAFVAEHGPAGFEPFGINSARVTPHGLRTIDSTRRLGSVGALVRENAPADVLRLGRWALRVSRREDDRWADSPYFERVAARLGGDHRLADVLDRRALDTIVRPLTVRMNGAEPDEALVSAFGANLGTLLDTYDQLSDGLRPVLERFAATIDCRFSTEVVGTAPGDRRRTVVVDGPAGREVLEADAVVLALPAARAAQLLRHEAPRIAGALKRVRYFPARVIVAEYDRDLFRPEVRAVVFGAGSVLSNAGAYGKDDLRTVRYTFSGRRARSELGRDPEDLLATAEAIVGEHTPVAAARRRGWVSASWDQAYCAFGPGHHQLARDAHEPVAPRLHVCGDFLAGASIEACFRAADRATSGLAALATATAGRPTIRTGR